MEDSGLPGVFPEGCLAVDYFGSGCQCYLSQRFCDKFFGLEFCYTKLWAAGTFLASLAFLVAAFPRSAFCVISLRLFAPQSYSYPQIYVVQYTCIFHTYTWGIQLGALTVGIPAASARRSGVFDGFQAPFQVCRVYASVITLSN